MKKFEQILLIDDDTVNNFLNLRIIKSFGLSQNIKTFLNGEEAIHFLEWHCIQEGKKCPDLILLDLNMPIMNGFEFLNIYNKLKFKKDHVEIVILTSSQDDRDVKKVKSYGIHHYLNKPLITENLQSFLDELSGTSLSA
jgi:CheY-like chemotaxis protein